MDFSDGDTCAVNVVFVELALTFNNEAIVLTEEVVQGLNEELGSEGVRVPSVILLEECLDFKGIKFNLV